MIGGTAFSSEDVAHFQLNEYGKSLGQVHSLHAPFFASSRQYAEGYILKMTNYFYNCQFDRVRRSLSQFKDFYGPIEKDLAEALTSRPADVGDEWFYEELLAAAAGTPRDSRLPANIARTVAANNRYRRLHNFLNRIAAEAEAIKAVDLFKGELSGELLTEIEAAKDQFRPFLGKLVKQKLDRQLRIVRGMMGQADIIDIQTGLAEAEWLEAQREIEFKVRKRLPRPFIPSDKSSIWPSMGNIGSMNSDFMNMPSNLSVWSNPDAGIDDFPVFCCAAFGCADVCTNQG